MIAVCEIAKYISDRLNKLPQIYMFYKIIYLQVIYEVGNISIYKYTGGKHQQETCSDA